MTYVDFNPETNFYLSSINQISLDPYKFLVPYVGDQTDYAKLFEESLLENGNFIKAVTPQNNQSNTNLNQSTSFNQTAASFTGFTASFDNSIANFNSAIENFGVKVGEFAAAVSVIPSSLTVNGEIGASVTTNAAGIVTQISEAVNAMIARQVIKSLPTPSMDEASKPS